MENKKMRIRAILAKNKVEVSKEEAFSKVMTILHNHNIAINESKDTFLSPTEKEVKEICDKVLPIINKYPEILEQSCLDNEDDYIGDARRNYHTIGLYSSILGFDPITLRALDNENVYFQQNTDGKTIGHISAENGDVEVFKKFLGNEKANKIVDNDGKIAGEYAEFHPSTTSPELQERKTIILNAYAEAGLLPKEQEKSGVLASKEEKFNEFKDTLNIYDKLCYEGEKIKNKEKIEENCLKIQELASEICDLCSDDYEMGDE